MPTPRLTDPEVLEWRYPVRLESYAIRHGSGGAGRWHDSGMMGTPSNDWDGAFWRADVDEARANLADAQRAQERLEVLRQTAAVTEDEVDRGRFKVQSLMARVGALQARQRLAEGQLQLSFLRAPFDGVIVRVDLEPGEVVSLFGVQSGVGAIEIADVSEIWVRIDVPEDRIGSVALGAPAEVAVDALGPEPLAAEVVEIAPVADRQSNTVKVAVRVLHPPPLLRPDMSARVTIQPKRGAE